MMGWFWRAVKWHRGLLLALSLAGLAVALSYWRQTEPRVRLPQYEGRVVEFAPGGRVMLTDGESGACLRNVATGRVVVELVRRGSNGKLRVKNVTCPRFTPDGRRVSFSPDSKRLVVSYRSEQTPNRRIPLPEDQCSVELWDVPGGWRIIPWLRGAALIGLFVSGAILDRCCRARAISTAGPEGSAGSETPGPGDR